MAISDGWGATKGKTFAIEVLTQEEISALLTAGSKRAPTALRDRALVATLYYGGLRLQEALDLMPRDIDLDAGAINVRRGKGGKQRLVALVGEGATQHLALWSAARQKKGLNGHHHFFCTIGGNQMDQSNFRARLKKMAAGVGIEKRVHPHGLRHSHAAALAMSREVPVHLIQEQLGHASLSVTARYISHLAPEERLRHLRKVQI